MFLIMATPIHSIEKTYNTFSDPLLDKVAKGYTNIFCNALAMGVSPDGAARLTIEENIKISKKDRGILYLQ